MKKRRKPNRIPPRTTTVGQLERTGDTGIAVGVNDEGMVFVGRFIEGVPEWGEEWHPDEADFIAKMLIEEAANARRKAAS